MRIAHHLLEMPPRLTLSLLSIVLSLLSPGMVSAQTAKPVGDPLDNWRANLSARLETDLARVAATVPINRPPRAINDGLREDMKAIPTALLPQPPLSWREPWLSTVAHILQNEGLPLSLLGVVAVESGFDPAALSPKGALGLWQLMPQTARRYGLEVSSRRDERLDPVKSTYAAADYLKDLYAQFGNWPLALAAYNAGEDRVQQALDRLGARDFWTLSGRSALPVETLRYVPAVLARISAVTAVPTSRDRAPQVAWNPARRPSKESSAWPQIVYATPSITLGPSAGAGR